MDKYQVGTFLDALDSIVLPMKVAIANRLSVGDEITLAAEGRTVTLTVAGRLKVGRDAFTLFYRCPQPGSTPFAGCLERAGSRAGRGHDRRR